MTDVTKAIQDLCDQFKSLREDVYTLKKRKSKKSKKSKSRKSYLRSPSCDRHYRSRSRATVDPISLGVGRDRAILRVEQELHTIEESRFLRVGQASHALIPDYALRVEQQDHAPVAPPHYTLGVEQGMIVMILDPGVGAICHDVGASHVPGVEQDTRILRAEHNKQILRLALWEMA